MSCLQEVCQILSQMAGFPKCLALTSASTDSHGKPVSLISCGCQAPSKAVPFCVVEGAPDKALQNTQTSEENVLPLEFGIGR